MLLKYMRGWVELERWKKDERFLLTLQLLQRIFPIFRDYANVVGCPYQMLLKVV